MRFWCLRSPIKLFHPGNVESAARAMTDMQNLNVFPLLQHAVDNSRNVWLVPVKQVPQRSTLRRRWAPVRLGLQT